MIRASALILALYTISCDSNHPLTEREIFQQKFSAFKILSDNHDYLHIMMGEHEGNVQEAFTNFSIAVPDGVDVGTFPAILIWCEAFGQFITAAELY